MLTAVRGIAVVVLVGLAFVAAGRWDEVREWLEVAGPGGAVAYAGGIALLMTGCFPVSVLGFTAGALYGPFVGYAIIVPAAVIAAALMYVLGKSVFRGPIRRWVEARPRLRAFEDVAADNALRLNLLARLSPFNFGIVCYTLAAGRSALRPYLLGLAGALPSMAVHVVVGHLVRSTGRALKEGEDGHRALQIGLTILAILALLALGWQVGRMAREAWRRAAEVDLPATDGEPDDGAGPR